MGAFVPGLPGAAVPRDVPAFLRLVRPVLLEYELLLLLWYQSAPADLVRYRDKVTVTAGRPSRDENRAYARSAMTLAGRLNCRFVVVPGHHSAYFSDPEVFSSALIESLLS